MGKKIENILHCFALRFIVLAAVSVLSLGVSAQIVDNDHYGKIDTDSLHRDFDKAPWFGLYKDNYFVFGPPVGEKANKHNTNVKFQISISQRLTKTTLPLGTYLYLFYTQKCMWNVLEESLPMTDLNFNPGIGLAKPLINRDGRFIGVLQLALEHESNGRDSIQSRSWNRITFGGSVMITPSIVVHGKFWIPFVDGENNPDLLRYTGLCQAGMEYNAPSKRFGVSFLVVKRKTWKLDFNTVVELNYRIFRNSNQFLFLQYYNGYGENLLDYKEFRSQIRVGLVIKPKLFSSY
jgi:phospholipase A1